MLKIKRIHLIFILIFSSHFGVIAQNKVGEFVVENPNSQTFSLVKNSSVPIIFDGDDEGVGLVVENLQLDIERVSSKKPQIAKSKSENTARAILVGQIGESELLDQLISSGKLKISGVAGKWESFIIETIENPIDGIDELLVIAGSDKRGTIFGVYELSEQIGVSPWYWWADVPVDQKDEIHIVKGRYVAESPKVKYRGIFINDEAPALAGWTQEKFGGFNHKLYENVFELILRLRGNYLWPAMWGRAFYDDDPLNGPMADKHGIVIGTSHHEPLMRAHVEWSRYGEGDWNYQTNREELQEFWREGMKRQGDFEATVSLGMRGDGDEPMSEENNIALLEEIIADQRRIIEEVTGKPASETPQYWALYKEVQEYYEKGMRVPDDVMLLLCDDNWGNVRKLPEIGAEPRTGGYGMYYHFDYVGGPRNYKWLNTNPLPRIWEQMNLTYQHGVDELWVVNVGDIKPMEFPISFFLDLAWNPNAISATDIEGYTQEWASKQFGKANAKQIGDLLAGYGKLSDRRKPELLDQKSYSLNYYNEFENVVKEWTALENLANTIKDELSDAYQDAYYQLILHPIEATANLHRLYHATAQNHLFAKQGRNTTNKEAEKVKELYEKDSLISHYYNNVLADGKWSHMMDQTHIGYTYWQQPETNVIPETQTIKIPKRGKLGVAVPGSESYFPNSKPIEVPVVSPYYKGSSHFELYNTGSSALDYKIDIDKDWLQINEFSGNFTESETIEYTVDWNNVPEGKHQVEVIVSSGKEKATLIIPVHNYSLPAEFKGFAGAQGVISFESDKFTDKQEVSPVRFEVLPDLGKTGNALTATPVTYHTSTDELQGSYISYDIWIEEAGTYEVSIYVSPTLNYLNSDQGLQFGIGTNDSKPKLLTLHAEGDDAKNWNSWVANGINQITEEVTFEQGKNQLKIYHMNPGIVFQKVVINTGGLQPSYLGPPESYFQYE